MNKINSIRASIVFEYNPDDYIYFCEERGETPTQKGFMEFIKERYS